LIPGMHGKQSTDRSPESLCSGSETVSSANQSIEVDPSRVFSAVRMETLSYARTIMPSYPGHSLKHCLAKSWLKYSTKIHIHESVFRQIFWKERHEHLCNRLLQTSYSDMY